MMTNLRGYLQRNKKIAKEQEKLTCMAAIGQMSAQIAHETRNSLYAIRGAVSGLEKVDNPAESKEYVEVIKEEIQEMKRMSDDFLQFARTPEPELIPCQVDEVVQRVAELLEPDLEEAGIRLERTGTAPRVVADPTLLKRAFMNLFLNAIQAMEDGGIIMVEYRLAGNFVEIRIQDEGPGIPEDVNLKVFQPFFSTKINGSGLGLPTVYKLMAAQHGEVDLEESETGARFMIQLPVADKSGA
jgi:signal transduction histidine kinase